MTELQEGQKLERLIRVYGVESPVIVTISTEGISFRVKGSKKSVTATWAQVVNACHTGTDVPSFLAGRPLELLKHNAIKAFKRRVAKAQKEH